MPVSWELRNRILIVTVNRDWEGGTPAYAIIQAIGDPHFQPGTTVLLDVRESEMNPTGAQIQGIASVIAGLTFRGLGRKFAIALGQQAYQYGLARMLEAYLQGSGMELRIFHELEGALEWLA